MGESIHNIEDFNKNPNIADGLKPILQNIGLQFNDEAESTASERITDISDIFAPATKQATSDSQKPEVIEARKEAVEYKKRYGDSTEENQRILAENKKYAPFKPLLEQLVNDETLAGRINDLVLAKGAPKSVVESLNLPDDFKFNSEEAVTDPNSPSAKLQYAIIGDAVEKRFNTLNAKTSKANAVNEQKKLIKSEIGDDKVYNDFMEFLGGYKPNYQDFLKIFTMNEREKLIATTAGKRVLEQVKRASELGEGNLGGLGDVESDVNQELAFYKTQFGIGDINASNSSDLIT